MPDDWRLLELVEDYERAHVAAGEAEEGLEELDRGPGASPGVPPLPSRISTLAEWASAERKRTGELLAREKIERLEREATDGEREIQRERLAEARAGMSRAIVCMLEAGMPPEVWVRVGDRGAILTEERTEVSGAFSPPDPMIRAAAVHCPDAPFELLADVFGTRWSPVPLIKAARRREVPAERALEVVRTVARHIVCETPGTVIGEAGSGRFFAYARELAARERVVEPGRLRLVLAPWEAGEGTPEGASVAEVVDHHARTSSRWGRLLSATSPWFSLPLGKMLAAVEKNLWAGDVTMLFVGVIVVPIVAGAALLIVVMSILALLSLIGLILGFLTSL